jgi:hypothetical protein
MKILACASIISFGLLSKLPYYVNGKIVHGLVFASFLSLIVLAMENLWKLIGFRHFLIRAKLVSLILGLNSEALILRF